MGKGPTEQPRVLCTLARALGAEATTSYLGPALVVQGGSREDWPSSSCMFAGGPIKSSGCGPSSSLIIRGPNPVCMPSQNSGQTEIVNGQRRLPVRQSSGKAQRCRGQRRSRDLCWQMRRKIVLSICRSRPCAGKMWSEQAWLLVAGLLVQPS